MDNPAPPLSPSEPRFQWSQYKINRLMSLSILGTKLPEIREILERESEARLELDELERVWRGARGKWPQEVGY